MVYIAKGTLTERQDWSHAGRIVQGNLGTPYVVANFTTWAVNIYDRSSGTPNTALYSLTGQDPTLVIYNTPQQNDAWQHSLPFNFAHTIEYTLLNAAGFNPVGGKTYTVEYDFVRTNGSTEKAIFRQTIVHSSS